MVMTLPICPQRHQGAAMTVPCLLLAVVSDSCDTAESLGLT